MAAPTDVGFVEMRLGKVVTLSMPEDDDPSFCVVLEGLSPDLHLPIEIGPAEAFTCRPLSPGLSLPGR
jgi:hypothetical protein